MWTVAAPHLQIAILQELIERLWDGERISHGHLHGFPPVAAAQEALNRTAQGKDSTFEGRGPSILPGSDRFEAF